MARFVLLAVCLALDCSPRVAEVDRTEPVFGSYLRVKALGPDKAALERGVARVFEEMRRFDSLWSSFREESEVSFLNRSGAARVSPETRELIESALEFGSATDGAFDITVRPVLDAWGITRGEKLEVRRQRSGLGSRQSAVSILRPASGLEPLNYGTLEPSPGAGDWRLPDSSELAVARGRVDYHRVEVRGDSVVLAPGTRIDLGGIGVGFAVDRAVEMLADAGAKQALVDAGGDIRVFGERVWRIGLRDPRGEGVVRVFDVRNRAVSTSGDYQKFFVVEGRRFHHIVNPKTGYPAGECVSVTVFAERAVEADAFATGVFALGPRQGLEKVRRREGMGAVVFVQSGDSLVTMEAGRVR